jgi:hypothetical protein
LIRVRIHPQISEKRPDIADEDVYAAFEGALRSRARNTKPIQWVGVGIDHHGRLLEFIAVEDEPNGWLVFHAMIATTKVLNEIGLGR